MKLSPKIIIPANIRNKIQFIVDNCALEVSGLGTVVFDKAENAYRVTDVILLDQEVGSAHTDIDDEAVAQACYNMKDSEGELAFWWHSHVNMSTFWSSTDHETMEAIGKNGLCVAIVFNKKEEMRGAIVMTPEGYPSYKVDEVAIDIEYDYDFDTTELLEEMKTKIREKKHTFPLTANTSIKTTDYYYEKDKDFRREALNDWAKMTKEMRIRWTDFDDYLDELTWNEYALTGNYIR